MSTKARFIIVALIFTIGAFMLGGNTPIGEMIWPPDTEAGTPSDAQLPFFMLLGVISALAFGVGIAYLFFGWSHVRRVLPDRPKLAVAMHLSIGWWLVNWFPHENLHIANGMDFGGLLAIEYVFHVTLIIAALVLAYGFGAVLTTRGAPTATSA